ncbi:MAG: hypothetical protein ACR2MG_16945 [Pyrinomonadaceae bacterium]
MSINQNFIRPFFSKTIALFFTVFLLTIFLFVAKGQPTNPTRGPKFGSSYALSDIETVNLTNGNLMLNFPLAGLPAGRGELGASINLTYNSKILDLRNTEIFDSQGQPTSQNIVALSPEGGWRYSNWYFLNMESRLSAIGGNIPCSSGEIEYKKNAYLWKLKMQFPDGSVREFRPTDNSDFFSDGYFNISNGYRRYTTISTLGNGSVSCQFGEQLESAASMVYYSTDGYLKLVIEHVPGSGGAIAPWTLYFPDGSRVTGGGAAPSRQYDRNGNYIEYLGNEIRDQFGRSISKQVSGIPNEDWIVARGFADEELKWKVRWKTVEVRGKNYRTQPANYGRTRGEESEQVYEAVMNVVDQIILPQQAGGLVYQFNYNADGSAQSIGWGELSEVILPSGAKAQYEYSLDGVVLISGRYPTANTIIDNKPKRKLLTYNREGDGTTEPVTEIWQYALGSETSTITAPDGGITTQTHGTTAISQSDSGLVYKIENADGTKIEKLWTFNTPYWAANAAAYQQVNPYVKAEFVSIKDAQGNYTLTAIKDYKYDKNGNITRVAEYDFVPHSSIPRGAQGRPTDLPSGLVPKRVTEMSYYNATADASDTTTNSAYCYWNSNSPNIRSAVQAVEVKNGSGQIASRSEMFYDNYATTGNPTQVKTWDSNKNGTYQAYSNPLTASNSISVTTQYDQYGNPIQTTDAKGNLTQTTYGAINGYTGLYPTQTITAYGASIAQTTTAEYDFYTGLVKKTTVWGNNANENVSTETEYDALGRPTKVKAAVGTANEIWTQTEYNDVVRRVIVRSDLETKGDGKKVTVQHYDQLGRVRLSRTIENAATEDPTNEQHGIKVQTRYQTGNPYSYQVSSNPYRAATSAAATNEQSMGWTRSKSVNTGRHAEVETFSGASLPAP